MTFIEWFEKNYTWLSGRMVRGRMNEAWDAGKAEERERCLLLCRQVASLPHAKSPVAWTTAAGYLAEQIRKGD